MTQQAKMRTYDLYRDGVRWGYIIKDETSELTFTSMLQKLEDVSGFPGVYQMYGYGLIPKHKVTLYDADIDTIRSQLLADNVTTNTSGAKKGLDFGTKAIDYREKAKTFLLHPHDKTDMSDQSEDFYFHLSVLDATSLKFLGSQRNYQSYDLMFEFLPDFEQTITKTYGTYGYRDITDTPLGSWIQPGKIASVPGMHLYAATLKIGQNIKLEGFNGYGEIVNTSTCKIANTAGYSGTDTSFDIDNISGTLVAGYYRNARTAEVYKIGAYNSGTFSSITRACWGTAATALNDADTLAYISSASVERHTDEGTWATSNAANVDVGNTYMGSGTANKGVLFHGGSASTSNITFTYGAVASPNLVATSS